MMDDNLQLWTSIDDLMRLMHVFREDKGKELVVNDVREKVWEMLRRIHDLVSTVLSESDAYNVVFALTVHCDEIVQKYLVSRNDPGWVSLQYQLYKTTNGGDMFYENLDSFRGRYDINALVYEVYYFCLSDGFSGKYMDNLVQLTRYVDEARAHITNPSLPDQSIVPAKQGKVIRRIPSWLYYAIAAIVVITSHLIFVNAADNYSAGISEYILGW